MALINCKECKTEVSSQAETCPKCGVRIAAKPAGCGTLIGILILGAIAFSPFLHIFSKEGERVHQPVETPASSIPQTTTIQEPERPASQWLYTHHDDPMSKGSIHQALVISSNTVNFGFPYSGEQHATLVLRNHPHNGKDVIFRIEKGQILCHTYDDCVVLVRFDDEPASNFTAVGAADNSTETIFIRNYAKFLEKVLKAKRVRIAVNIYQQGAPVFDFEVDHFDQDKYIQKK